MASPEAAASEKSVLVADDTAFVRDRFRAALEKAGHRALTARTAPELFAQLRDHASFIDLVILDLRLPQGNGVNMVRAIRATAGRPQPLLLFSGTIATAEEVRELASLGVAGYVNEYTAGRYIVPALAPHLFPEHYNRRSSPRVALGIPVACRSGASVSSTLTTTISRGGLALRTTSSVPVGTELRVRFKLPGGRSEIDASAMVAWSSQNAGMGIRFTKVDPSSQSAIDDYVQSHFFSNRKA
jgi:two-component system chemotaxis response regulator CheY